MEQTKQDAGLEQDLALDDILNEYRSAPTPSVEAATYQIPAPQPAPRRSSLPTEAEVRAYLASYARGAAEPSYEPQKKPPEEPLDVDSRFLMGEDRPGRHSTLRYGSQEIDLSADESYQPPQADGFIATHSPDKDENAESDVLPKWKLLSRAKEKLEEMRVESAEKEERRRAARKIRYPEPKELILPGEEPPAESSAVRPEAEPVPGPDVRESEAEEYASEPEIPFPTPEASEEPAEEPAEEPKPEPEPEKPVFTPSWTRSAASTKEYASLFPDTSASPAIYAEKPEIPTPPDDDASIPLKPDRFFPANVREYLMTLLTTVFYGMRKASGTIRTAEEDDEDLGPEDAPAYASRYYGRQTRSLRLRLQICGVLELIMAWISFGLPVSGQLANIRIAAYFCLCLQFGVMLLCQDVLTGGVLNAFRRKPGADSMAVLACLVTSLDALLVGAGVITAPHMPFCLLSSLSLTGVLLSSLISCRALRKALRVPAIAKRAYTVTGEMSMKDHGTTILKSQRPYTGFVRRSEEAPPDEILFQKLCLPLLMLVALLTLLTLAFTKNVKDFLYILSVLLCASVPFGALLCFALPFFTGSFRIFPSGAAIAGWSGLCDIGQSKNLIVTDRDLFPDGTVDIEQVRIFADARPDRIISYAGSMLTACGCCLSKPFGDLMERNHCAMRQIENFEFLPGGGMRGVIDSSVILCGSSELMQLMNVRIPFRLVKRTSVLLAVDGVLYGIFNVQYTADPQVRKALIGLLRTTRHPIFAIRDFNVTPTMLSECFDVATDGYDFPPYVERFAISSAAPEEDSKVAAVVCRDGLGPLSDMANTGRSMYVSVRTALYATAAGAVLGVLLCFLRLVSTGGVSVLFLFLFMLFWLLPVLIAGFTLGFE